MVLPGLRCLTVACALSWMACGAAAEIPTGPARYPGTEWERADPLAAGWSVETIAKAWAYADLLGSTSVMVVQHGRIIAERGDTAVKSNLYSVRKSLLSALIGIAVGEGRIDLGATLAQLGIDD